MRIRSTATHQHFAAIPPQIGISADPGSRNLGWAILRFKVPVSFNSLCLDTNYEIIELDHLDIKKTKTGEEGDDSRAHYVQMVDYHFYDPESNSTFLKTLNKLQDEPDAESYEYSFFSENQEGIGQNDRETNPYLADQLLPMALISGALGMLMYRCHGINNINFPAKVSKWGNSSCPYLEIKKTMTKKEKQAIQGKNKTIRKNFFVHFIMDLLERQKNNRILAKLSRLPMDERAHLCDAVTQAMRAMLVQLWIRLETQFNNGRAPANTKVPMNKLPDDVTGRVYAKLGTIKISVETTVKTPGKRGIKKQTTKKPKKAPTKPKGKKKV